MEALPKVLFLRIMSGRKECIESITQSMYAIRHKALACDSAKSTFTHPEKNSITPSQLAVLETVMEKQPTNLKDIAEGLGITSSAATQLVDGLVGKDYLVREHRQQDRRVLL